VLRVGKELEEERSLKKTVVRRGTDLFETHMRRAWCEEERSAMRRGGARRGKQLEVA